MKSCRVFRGCWSQVSDSYLTSFLLQTWKWSLSRLITMGFHGIPWVSHTTCWRLWTDDERGFGQCWNFPIWLTKKNGQMIFHKPFLYSTNIPFPPFTAWVIASHECSRTPGSREMMPAPFFSQILLHATTTTLKLKSLQKILWIHDQKRAVFLKSYHHPVDLEQCCVPFKSITTKSIYSQPSLSAPPLGIVIFLVSVHLGRVCIYGRWFHKFTIRLGMR